MLNVGHLYHYTSYNALKFILPGRSALAQKGIVNKDTEFRFTRYDYLNDCNEGKILYEYLAMQKENICNQLKKVMGDNFSVEKYDEYIENSKSFDSFVKKKYNECFAFCASRLRDSSQFWLSPYANQENGGGICLCINGNDIDKQIECLMVECVKNNEFLYQSYVDYLDPYGRNDGETVSSEILEKLKFIIENQFIINDNFCVKYAGWKSEEEFRWLYRPSSQSIQYDNDGKQTARARLYFNCVIDEIILGPSFEERDVGRIEKELNNRGYGQIKISLSKVKIRR